MTTEPLQIFLQKVAAKRNPRILELGTRRWNESIATHHKHWFVNPCEYVMSDFLPGIDVDQVADIHGLSDVFFSESFDAVVACSVFEHVQKPWIAANEILKVLKPGGVFFIQTHQTFPIHGYPNDYFRYTREGLETCFEQASHMLSAYEFPCQIVADVVKPPHDKDCYLNVVIYGIK